MPETGRGSGEEQVQVTILDSTVCLGRQQGKLNPRYYLGLGQGEVVNNAAVFPV